MNDIRPDSAETIELLEAIRRGERQAFDRLFARHRPYLKRVIELRLDVQLRGRVDASDIVQDTQLDAFRQMSRFLAKQPMPLRLWLRRTAQRRLYLTRRQHLGTARRAVDREVQLPNRSSLLLARQLLAPGKSPSQQLVTREQVQAVRNAMGQLSPGDHEILLMRMYERLTSEEIACVLDLSAQAVRQRYGRALVRLKTILEQDGFTGSEL